MNPDKSYGYKQGELDDGPLQSLDKMGNLEQSGSGHNSRIHVVLFSVFL